MIPPFPAHITIDVHDYCDARCSYCPYSRLAADPMRVRGIMGTSLLVGLLDECAVNLEHLESIRFGNIAESFVRPEIWLAIEAALARRLPLYIDSNMTRLDATALATLDALGFAGKVYAHVQPDMGVDLEVQERNFASARALWGDRVERVEINNPRRWPGDPTIPERPAVRCGADRPDTTMIIGHDGRVQLCCVDVERQAIVGDVSESTIAAVWQGAEFGLARHRLAARHHDLCNHCEWGEVA